MKEKSVRDIILIILKAMSLAMGVAITALSIMNEVDTNTAIRLLAFGLACSGAAHVIDAKKDEIK